MRKSSATRIDHIISNLVIIVLGIGMLYPIMWLFTASV
ncbi:MAG: carbohydrate ABC transporter permease, partial [Spirochaetales bacterium]|nr:carbohydrate ABC transporter permease [Spirochaetales bacterium]